MSDKKIYWAAAPTDKIGSEIIEKCDEYYRFLESSGLLRKFRKAYDMYYGYSSAGYFQSTSDVGQGGEQGELSLVKVNHFRNLIQHLLVMTTSSRPALEARAANTDMKSKAQTVLANGVIDYYLRDKRLERFLKTGCELSLFLGEGFVDMDWDTTLGEPYGVDPVSGRVLHEGDIKYSNPMGPLDVARDIHAQDGSAVNWRIVTSWVSKYDLAAKYPDKADKILAINPSIVDRQYQNVGGQITSLSDRGELIPVRKLLHKKTEAMPEGRYTLALSGNLVLFDGPMPYANLPGGMPIYRIVPSEFFGTPFGYSPSWDVIGLSEIYDALMSVVTTNQTSFGVQNIMAPKGHDVSHQQLTGGLNLIEYDPKLGKPEALNLTQTPPEIFNFIEKIGKEQAQLLGLNDVVLGDPQASLKSGSALALVASQAIQFNSGLQASYIALLEDVGTATIKMLQTFANTKRVASIAGKSERFMIREFSSQDIDQINRVVVDVTNPLSRTVSGRMEMARDLLQIPGLIKHPDQYLQILETGNYRPLVQGQQAELLTIDAENEMLQEGQMPQSVLTDDHALHVREHKSVLAMPDSRLDARVVAAVTAHIQQHIDLLTTTDPRVLIVTGQQPLPPPPMPGMGGPMPAPTPGAGAPPPGAPAPEILDATNPVLEQSGEIQPARMPTNPLTGEPFDPQGGPIPA